MTTFVDNIKIMGTKKSCHIKRVKAQLAIAFEIVNMGLISFYLALKIERDREKQSLQLSPPAYIEKILAKYYFYLAKSYNISMIDKMLLPNK